MQQFAGKTAFITGGASGIGFGLARAFGDVGMRIVLADIEPEALSDAVGALRETGATVLGVACDVADADSVARAGEAAFAAFGQVHIVCNNAGVAGGGGIDAISVDTWRWVVDVNLMGVVHGIRTFLPHIRAHGEGGHFVNTASMAGLNSGLGFSPYSATKFAVINISEGLASQLAPLGIGVSVVCPGFVRTRISESRRNRQERYGPAVVADPASAAGRLAREQAVGSQAGIDPAEVAARTLAAIRAGELYVFTHADGPWREEVATRFETILGAMDRAGVGRMGDAIRNHRSLID